MQLTQIAELQALTTLEPCSVRSFKTYKVTQQIE